MALNMIALPGSHASALDCGLRIADCGTTPLEMTDGLGEGV